jgi:hypothetical protein
MNRIIVAFGVCVFASFVACKNDAKPTDPSATENTQLTAEQVEAEKKHAVTIDSMTQSIEQLEKNIHQASDDLDKAINELPE